VFAVKNGTDIILRKSIKKTTQEPMEEDGEPVTVWECEEKQYRHKGSITKKEVTDQFDYFWALADGATEEEATDQAAEEAGEPTLLERVEAVEDAIMELAEVIING
jgi:hypothetical protein